MNFKLYMLLLGCRPTGRNTEQHDVYFGVAKELKDLIPEIKTFWKGARTIHIDAWRVVNNVDGYNITIVDKKENNAHDNNLFFLNLGGYKANEFEEFHYKILSVSKNQSKAILAAKQTTFFKHTGFGKFAASHVDNKYGVDVDDIFEVKDILSSVTKEKFSIHISNTKKDDLPADEINLGYFKLDSL